MKPEDLKKANDLLTRLYETHPEVKEFQRQFVVRIFEAGAYSIESELSSLKEENDRLKSQIQELRNS
jgi:hypothetical protein